LAAKFEYCLSLSAKNPASSWPELPTRPDNENALLFQLLEKPQSRIQLPDVSWLEKKFKI